MLFLFPGRLPIGMKQRHSSAAMRRVQRIPAMGDRDPSSILPRTVKKLAAQTMPPMTLSAKIIYQIMAESTAPKKLSLRVLERYAFLIASESFIAEAVLLSKYVLTLAFIIITVPFFKMLKEFFVIS